MAKNPSCDTLSLPFFGADVMVMANQSTAFPKLKFLCVFKRWCTGACNCPNINPTKSIRLEPTAGLDPKERVRLRELLADMAKDRIILVATHVVSDVETVATKVILLRAGKIVDAAPVPELIEKYAPGQGLEDVYLNVFGEGDGK